LPSSTGNTTELILTHDGSYDAVSRKIEVPFGGYKIYVQHFNLFFHKNMKITMAPMGKIKHLFKAS